MKDIDMTATDPAKTICKLLNEKAWFSLDIIYLVDADSHALSHYLIKYPKRRIPTGLRFRT